VDAWPPFFVDYLARRTWWCRLLSRFSSAVRFGGLSGVFPLCFSYCSVVGSAGFFIFFSSVSPLWASLATPVWLFQAMSVNYFLLNEIRALLPS
jgi:hypothetical protein